MNFWTTLFTLVGVATVSAGITRFIVWVDSGCRK